jgi:hypothetical protein
MVNLALNAAVAVILLLGLAAMRRFGQAAVAKRRIGEANRFEEIIDEKARRAVGKGRSRKPAVAGLVAGRDAVRPAPYSAVRRPPQVRVPTGH